MKDVTTTTPSVDGGKANEFLSDLVTYTKYASYLPEKKRRQTWEECVESLKQMHKKKYPQLSEEIDDAFDNYVTPKKVLPSMRSVQFGGLPIELCPNRIYNCSYAPCEHPFIFSELLFLLLGGTGTGYSVRSRHVKKFPMIQVPDGERRFLISDCIEGWADSIRQLIYAYMYGKTLPKFDYRDIRPKGSPIKKTGGTAPGPSKLIECHKNIEAVLKNSIGRRLQPLEVHDICCYLADCVLAGGIREAAMISIFDLDDMDMITCKGIFEVEDSELLDEDDNKRVVKVKLKEGQTMNTNVYGREDGEGYIKLNMSKKFGDYDFNNLRENGQLAWYYVHPQRARANNSAALRRGNVKKKQFMDLWKRTEETGSGDPGILWVNDDDSGTNPCLTAETMVYVADGRGMVSIGQLAKEGKDVDVFCYDRDGNISVRRMRNPRLTGRKKKVFKITLDDGSAIRATENHRFRAKDGSELMVRDMKEGDSLDVIHRFESNYHELMKLKSADRGGRYYFLSKGESNKWRAEHRYIAEQNYGDISDDVIHHKNFDGLDNSPSNLQPMKKKDHDKLHNDLLIGDNNPMSKLAKDEKRMGEYKKNMSSIMAGEGNPSFSGVGNEEIEDHAMILTKKLGRRFSVYEWAKYARENKLPTVFSKFRQNALGTVQQLAKRCASHLCLEHTDIDPRVVRTYEKYLGMGYDAVIVGNHVEIEKECPNCSNKFNVKLKHREISYCSKKCADEFKTGKSAEPQREGLLKFFEKQRLKKREEQTKIYSGLKFELGRNPKKKEWVEKCKENGISPEICRESSPFRSYSELQEAGDNYNHKVVSVEFDGYEDVFNGTVDESHNFFVGGFASKTPGGKDKWTFINSFNCGEISLHPYQFCNLTTAVVYDVKSQEELNKLVSVAAFIGTLQAGYTDFHYLRKVWKETTERESLLGVSMTGIASGAVLDFDLKEAARYVADTNEKIASKIGINKAARLTCIKPEGSGTLVRGIMGNGIHPMYGKYVIRNNRLKKSHPVYNHLKAIMPKFIEDEFNNEEDGAVISIPLMAPNGAITRKESTFDMLERIKRFSDEWVKSGHKKGVNTHNVSATVYVKPEEWSEVASWMWEHRESYNGITVLPYDGGNYKQAPFIEVDKETYMEMLNEFPENVDFTKIVEEQNNVELSQELACSGGSCEI